MSSADNLLDCLSTRRSSVSVTEPKYRLYYNAKTGEPEFYTMEQFEGTYITVTQEEYNIGNYNIRVVNNAIVPHELPSTIRRLYKSNTGTATHPTNVLIVDKTSNTYWSLNNAS